MDTLADPIPAAHARSAWAAGIDPLREAFPLHADKLIRAINKRIADAAAREAQPAPQPPAAQPPAPPTVNSPRPSTRDGKRKMVLASENGQKKLIHYGDSKMGAHPDDPDRKSNFRARHSCDEKKSKLSAGYWACKDW